MSAKSSMEKARFNASSMANSLPSTESMRHRDACRGIHGHAKARRGIKRGAAAARRRFDKEVITRELEEQ